MNGFLNIYKSKGMTSAQVVGKIKHILGKNTKVGHMGTLDPLASGVLPIAIGRATRLFDFLLQKTKTYLATFQFGISTDTLDITGNIMEQNHKIPTAAQILEVLPNFIGEIHQIPPKYSAKSIQGKRAYQLARSGCEMELQPCKIHIHNITLTQQITHDTFVFSITCSSGTYIRSIARDMGIALGTVATMIDLVRTQSGPFQIQDSMPLDKIDVSQIISMDYILSNIPRVDITAVQLQHLLDGKPLLLDNTHNHTYTLYCDSTIQCICDITDGYAKPKVWLR